MKKPAGFLLPVTKEAHTHLKEIESSNQRIKEDTEEGRVNKRTVGEFLRRLKERTLG